MGAVIKCTDITDRKNSYYFVNLTSELHKKYTLLSLVSFFATKLGILKIISISDYYPDSVRNVTL